MLELKTSFRSGILNIELYGALDALTAPDFKYWLTEKSQSGYHYFALNCGGLEYISSRGIGILSELNYVLNGQKHRLVLYHVSNEVLNLLEFLKLSEVIPIVENLQQVYSKFKEAASQKVHVETAAKSSDSSNFVGVMAEAEEEMETAQPSAADFNHASNAAGQASSENAAEKNEEVNEEVNEEYIDLSNHTTSTEPFDVVTMNIVFCPNCGQSLRVSKKGLYLCPDCRTKFNYPFQ